MVRWNRSRRHDRRGVGGYFVEDSSRENEEDSDDEYDESILKLLPDGEDEDNHRDSMIRYDSTFL
ncbi:hypothetical protein CRE_26537 [Caenorhabditis remanei]|uniref:Uncharacterized protein n=1 Tax=Caenorhabditis remanei TaxID=31234 RepID=E3LR42_CAERE|nr:hypothetical protein CRE_26537 [Caenorhabditis remanei]